MSPLGAIVLALRFACELGAIAIAALWGYRTGGWPMAISSPLAIAVIWGSAIAPRAARRLHDPVRFIVESLIWAAATMALVDLDRLAIAISFAIVALVTAVAARRFEPQVSKSRRDA